MRIDTYFAGTVLVVISDVFAVLGLLLVRRVLKPRDLLSTHNVGGYLLSVVGTLYAVMLGLIVVDSMRKFQEAVQTTGGESNSLADVVHLSNQLPVESRDRIRKLALVYVDRVVNEEWPILDEGQTAPSADRAALNLIDAVNAFRPKDSHEEAIHAAQLTEIGEFWDNRRERMASVSLGVPTLEWVVLLVGGMITVAFTYFFKLDHLFIQALMTVMVTTLISLNLMLVLMFAYPYSGQLKVSSAPFHSVQRIIDHQNGSRMSEPAGNP